MAKYRTPGVYIEEVNAFPNSAVAVETAVPVFIGYTYKAERNGKSLVQVPTRINSFAEYLDSFGGAFTPTFCVETVSEGSKDPYFNFGGERKRIHYAANNELYFFNSIRLFYANGGGACVIHSVGVYGNDREKEIRLSDFQATESWPEGPFELLKNEGSATLVVLPDLIAMGAAAYPIYKNALAHCAGTQSRFGIFDLRKQDITEQPAQVLGEFREAIGEHFLNYGAAYYPWLHTYVVSKQEITFDNFTGLTDLLEPEVAECLAIYETAYAKVQADPAARKLLMQNHHNDLLAASPLYQILINQALVLVNQLPPSAGIAGLYTMIDNTRGVWKAPANYSLNNVHSPTVNLSSSQQEEFNVDPNSGKSVNVIRRFQGSGTLVWGARTLDGNSQDWRYINVRRTLIMIEQSIKFATRAYVFEPNDASTWATVKAMISNFLYNLWKQGALAGQKPDDAYYVQVGLGQTMTSNDMLEGRMLIQIGVAITRPAEFIIITFQQQLQQS